MPLAFSRIILTISSRRAFTWNDVHMVRERKPKRYLADQAIMKRLINPLLANLTTYHAFKRWLYDDAHTWWKSKIVISPISSWLGQQQVVLQRTPEPQDRLQLYCLVFAVNRKRKMCCSWHLSPCQPQQATGQVGGQRQPRGGKSPKGDQRRTRWHCYRRRELIVIVILCFWGHLFSRAGRPVERNCKIKVHSNLIHARLHLRGCG